MVNSPKVHMDGETENEGDWEHVVWQDIGWGAPGSDRELQGRARTYWTTHAPTTEMTVAQWRRLHLGAPQQAG